MAPYTSDFRLSVTRALRDQLIDALNALDAVPLDIGNIVGVARRGGVYELFEEGVLVYVGKSTRNLNSRLTQHRVKISGRTGGLAARMTFKAVYVDEDLDAVAPETLLIAQYRDENLVAWNTMGFGNKDPGKNRDKSVVKAGHFDAQYPIDLDCILVIDTDGANTLMQVMKRVKVALPFTFRYEEKGHAAASIRAMGVEDVPTTLTVRDWMSWIVERMGDKWAVVALPGYVIAYPNLDVNDVQSRIGAWHVEDGVGTFIEHTPLIELGAVELDPEQD